MTQTKEDRKRAAWETVGKEREKAAATIAALQQERDDLRRVLEDVVELEDDGDKSYRWSAALARAREQLAATPPRERDRQAGAEVDVCACGARDPKERGDHHFFECSMWDREVTFSPSSK